MDIFLCEQFMFTLVFKRFTVENRGNTNRLKSFTNSHCGFIWETVAQIVMTDSLWYQKCSCIFMKTVQKYHRQFQLVV